MLLGIVLHAILAYFPFPWPVQDSQQHRWLAIVYAAIHGFRMPLFFLLSGFFAAMVLQRRGLRSLLWQRVLRIALPLAVGMLTIVPLDQAVISWAVQQQVRVTTQRSPLAGAILSGDTAGLKEAIEHGDLASGAAGGGQPPLVLAALTGNELAVAALLDAGGAVETAAPDGSTALHAASYMGELEVVQLLLAEGADATSRNTAGKRPLETLAASPEIAEIVRRFLGGKPKTLEQIVRGRDQVRALLVPLTPAATVAPHLLDRLAANYQKWLASPAFRISLPTGAGVHLFAAEVFDHLWFLWFLCWLVGVYAVAEVAGCGPGGRWRWGLPLLSCLPQVCMAAPFGPDTALGLLPLPHLLLYYGCFFWFGASTYVSEGQETRLGKHWKLVLPLACLVVLPAGFATIGTRAWAMVLQPAFAWTASLGLIGGFRCFFAKPIAGLRWLADASYWMYLVHLPLVIAVQAVLLRTEWPALLKILLVIAVSVAVLLVSYRWGVRYTLIGRMLNGARGAVAKS